MAKQTSTLTVTGKLGNVVGYKGRGKSLARIRVTEIKNPNSEGQAIQRMITATNARAYSRLKAICDHSFEGVAYKQPSMDFFLKENAKTIRQWVANNYPEFTETNVNNYVGLSGVSDAYASGVGLLISKGSLQTIPCYREIGADETQGYIWFFGNAKLIEEGAVIKISDVLDTLGAQLGDQITLLVLVDGTLHYSRLIISPNASATDLAKEFTDANLSAVLDSSSIIGDVTLSAVEKDSTHCAAGINYQGLGFDEVAGLGVNGYAIILSRKDANGNWLRSTQHLIWANDADVAGLQGPDGAIPEWIAGKTTIDVANPWYLNQAKNAAQ